ncbi:unnamed protein product [Closterium sp. NIES-65]|nr:unnamed protein product [Closterium sp. NIES-65]
MQDPRLLRSRLTVDWLVLVAETRRQCMASAPLHSLRDLQEGVCRDLQEGVGEEEEERGSSDPGTGGRWETQEDEEDDEDDWEDIQERRDGGQRRGGRGSGRGVEGRGGRGSRGGRGGNRAMRGRGGSSRGRGRGGGRGGVKRPLEALARANLPNLIFAKIPVRRLCLYPKALPSAAATTGGGAAGGGRPYLHPKPLQSAAGTAGVVLRCEWRCFKGLPSLKPSHTPCSLPLTTPSTYNLFPSGRLCLHPRALQSAAGTAGGGAGSGVEGAFAFTPGLSRVLQPQQEVVLRVEVLQQEKRQLKGQEFLVLGSQPLTALRDRIYCLQDRIAREHGKSVPSGCFCIECRDGIAMEDGKAVLFGKAELFEESDGREIGDLWKGGRVKGEVRGQDREGTRHDVFYDDMRQPSAVRYSAVIVKWNREKRAAWSMLDERERRRHTPLARLPLPAPVRGMALGGIGSMGPMGSMGTSHTFQEDGDRFGQQQHEHQQYHQVHHHQQQQRVRLSLGDAPPPEYSSARMETTRFRDLTVRPGALYVYMHQGACKHAFRITDIRLLHPLDALNASEYPLLSHEPRCYLRRCSVCDVNASTRVVYHDKLLAVDPSFLCEQCYHLLHYDEEGNLLYSDFQVYNYYHE